MVKKSLSPERELQKQLAQQAAAVAQALTVQQILAEGPTAATHTIRGAAVQIGSPTVIARYQVRSPVGSDSSGFVMNTHASGAISHTICQ